MIQFNLLPDVKLEYIKAQRVKRAVITISGLVVGACIVFILILVSNVYGLQSRHINNVTEDIEKTAAEIKSIDQIDRILTVQSQLGTVNDLHVNKPVMSRIFDFIETVTPSNVNLANIELNHEENTLELIGSTESLAVVNKFVDTLKFTEYYAVDLDDNGEVIESSLPDDDDELPLAFTSVVLEDFDLSEEDGTPVATYTIVIEFDEIIFDSLEEIQLRVRDTITTRSEVDQPEALFQAPEEEEDLDG